MSKLICVNYGICLFCFEQVSFEHFIPGANAVPDVAIGGKANIEITLTVAG
jgi:hypothetical protein